MPFCLRFGDGNVRGLIPLLSGYNKLSTAPNRTGCEQMASRACIGWTEIATKITGRGHSLGLAFCKLAVEAHGGHIGVESTIGQGSHFRFLLPLTLPTG